MRALVSICWLALALPAWGDEPERANPPTVQQAPAPKRPVRRHFGASVELGSPDIIGVSLLGQPLWWMRLQLGLGTDTGSVGVHGGITFVPLDRRVSPSLTLEGGHMFEGSSSVITSLLSPKAYVIGAISYDYANGHVGVEVLLGNRVVLYAHAGASFISMQISGHKRTPPTTGSLTISDPSLQIWTFSGKLGVAVYFL
jgi:hypothetical protein